MRLLAQLGEGPNVLLPTCYSWYDSSWYAFVSPLGIALRHGRRDLALALLRAGADPKHGALVITMMPPVEVNSLLHAFCLCEPTPAALEELLSLPGATANRALESTTPIDSINSPEPALEVTPLQVAYWRRDFDTASVLLKAGAHPGSVAFDPPAPDRMKHHAFLDSVDRVQRLIRVSQVGQ